MAGPPPDKHAPDKPAAHRFVFDSADALRADRFLVAHIPELSRKRARELFDSGAVTVNGRIATKGALLSSGDRVEVHAPIPAADFEPTNEPGAPLTVLYEDAACVVVCKPEGIPCHPLRANETGTLVQALTARYPEMRGIGYSRREPGIIHRIDTFTSGAIIAARTEEAFHALVAQQAARGICKDYVAICHARPSALPPTLDFDLEPDPKNKKRVRTCEPSGKTLTLITETEATAHEELSIVHARLTKGLRHQIRAHLAAARAPILGDHLYGAPRAEELPANLERLALNLEGHFLHACRVTFISPWQDRRVSVDAPLSAQRQHLLDQVRR